MGWSSATTTWARRQGCSLSLRCLACASLCQQMCREARDVPSMADWLAAPLLSMRGPVATAAPLTLRCVFGYTAAGPRGEASLALPPLMPLPTPAACPPPPLPGLQEEINHALTHELVHAYDHCRAKNLDWTNCQHHACSEIRAAALSGERARAPWGTLARLLLVDRASNGRRRRLRGVGAGPRPPPPPCLPCAGARPAAGDFHFKPYP